MIELRRKYKAVSMLCIIVVTALLSSYSIKCFIQSRYHSLVTNSLLLNTFVSDGQGGSIQKLVNKYHLEYEIVEKNTIIFKSKPYLYQPNIVTVQPQILSGVLQDTIRENLLQTQPYIALLQWVPYIYFPIIAKNSGYRSYIVYARLLP